jgi:hypothetical protein
MNDVFQSKSSRASTWVLFLGTTFVQLSAFLVKRGVLKSGAQLVAFIGRRQNLGANGVGLYQAVGKSIEEIGGGFGRNSSPPSQPKVSQSISYIKSLSQRSLSEGLPLYVIITECIYIDIHCYRFFRYFLTDPPAWFDPELIPPAWMKQDGFLSPAWLAEADDDLISKIERAYGRDQGPPKWMIESTALPLWLTDPTEGGCAENIPHWLVMTGGKVQQHQTYCLDQQFPPY